MAPVRIAILGSGNIGTDLLVKVLRSPHLTCSAFLGRNLASQGIAKARSLGVEVSADGIEYVKAHPGCCDIVFDATSARSHAEHAPVLERLGKFVIDLTPAKLGPFCVPAVNMEQTRHHGNVNMVTCGGQASIPIAYAMGQTHANIDYIEVVSSIASRSAGPATRLNLDEYIHTTERGVQEFSGARRCKAILNLNPAVPCIHMQTTIFAKIEAPRLDLLEPAVHTMVQSLRRYVPGYQLVVGPLLENGRVVVTVRVEGLGDYLPAYAGNLDIINCAAIAAAENWAHVHAPAHAKSGEALDGEHPHQ